MPVLAGQGAQAPLTAAQATTLSTNVSDNVIVVFKDQAPSLPDTPALQHARGDKVTRIQASVLNELRSTRAQKVKSTQVVNAITARVSPGEAKRLSANPAVAAVVPDRLIPIISSPLLKHRTVSGSPLPGTCPANGDVQLNPEAILAIHAASDSPATPSAQSLGYTGKGVKVAFIADGLDINNPDFIRPNGEHVFVDYQDFSNTGSGSPTSGAEAFLDASAIAAQGLHTYDVSTYGAGLNRPCPIRILGVAPGASLVGINVFGGLGQAFNSVFLQAIDWAVSIDHVNVLNESFGDNPFPDQGSLDLIRMINDAAVAAGVTVVVGSGDSGPTNTIGSPATDPNVISAGATTTYRAYAQTGIGGITFPGVTGWIDNNISALSSGGFTQDGSTVNVVAPGDLNWALCTPNLNLYFACSDFSGNPASVQLIGGTSQAAPLTSGVAAMVIQAYAQSHSGSLPTPAIVKQIITSTADDIDAPADQQGAGLLDAYKAVLAARSFAGAAASGDAVLSSASQLHASGLPGTTQTLSDTLSNGGAHPLRVNLSTRTLGAYQRVAETTVALNDSTGDTAIVHFRVPRGMARLDGAIAFVGAGPIFDFAAIVNLSLIDPSGRLAEYNLPQGTGNFSDAQVADPAPGQWTAVIFGPPSSAGGTTGPVLFGARVAPWAAFGTVSPSAFTLKPGASQTVKLTVSTPGSPGDEAGAIVIQTNGAGPSFTKESTVPVSLRAEIPTPSRATTFTGTLTGGNGRAQSEAQSNDYQVQIPAGLPALNATISLPNSTDEFVAVLIDPTTGEAASTSANSLYSVGSGGFTPQPQNAAELHVLNPEPGLWTLSIAFYGQVSGTDLSVPFTVTLDTNPPVTATASLPDSASTKLAAGATATYPVTVTNTTAFPEEYFLDSRLNQSSTYSLTAQTSASTPVPVTGVPPEYVVPSHTTSITASALSSSAAIYFDFWWYFGDPDLISPVSTNPSSTLSASSVVPGLWAITPFQSGPDGVSASPPDTANTEMTATTQTFDSTVSSTTGDGWMTSINPSAAFSPIIVQPGQTVSIPVTITPSGRSGTTVRGTLYLADTTVAAGDVTWVIEALSPAPSASDVAAIPYAYTIE